MPLSYFKHLLPRAKAWSITIDKTLREFFEGLTGLPDDLKEYFDAIYNSREPSTTDSLVEYEEQFGLPDTGLTEQERRDRLDAAWKALGGQSPRYIQDTLQANGFDVYVREWWQGIPSRPLGGSVNNDVTPVARNPLLYLNDTSGVPPYLACDGAADMQDGDALAYDGYAADPTGYPLVNKIFEAQNAFIADGAARMQDGSGEAQDGGISAVYSRKVYTIPTGDPSIYPYFLYIGGATFPDAANILVSRRDEFEDLCLKICPTHLWLGMLINYS